MTNSVHVDTTAMKPVRLASGASEAATPMSQPQLQPKGLQMMQVMSTGNRGDASQAPNFTVIASHYQEQQMH